jgi:predicted DNA-binding transcriptional regulator AlpA
MNMNKCDENKELLDDAESAKFLGLKNPKTLAVWRSTKRYPIPYVKLGRMVRYRKKDLQALLDSKVVLPNSLDFGHAESVLKHQLKRGQV